MEDQNFKGKLITYCLKTGKKCEFRDGIITGPAHDRRFTAYAYVEGKLCGEAEGTTKKIAVNVAAKIALNLLENNSNHSAVADPLAAPVETPAPAFSSPAFSSPAPQVPASSERLATNSPPTETRTSPSVANNDASVENMCENYIGTLHQFCQKRKKTLAFLGDSSGLPHLRIFTAQALIDGEKYGKGEGRTKKIAENLAARMTLLSLQENSNPPTVSAPVVATPAPQLPERQATHSGPVDTQASSGAANMIDHNYIGTLNEFCQKKTKLCIFLEKFSSPLMKFTCSVQIDDHVFPEATGNTKKEAKKMAAYLALKDLRKHNPYDIVMSALDYSYNGGSGSENSSVSGSGDVSHDKRSTENESSVPLTETDSETPISTPKQSTLNRPPTRKVELAANFMNEKQECNLYTEDEIFRKQFENIIILGSGAFGTVYKATKKLEQIDYVVKKVKLKNEKVTEEVKTLARLDHPRIVRYFNSWDGYDHFADSSCSSDSSNASTSLQKCLFIQMEWCEGGTLKTWIEKRKTVIKNESLEISSQLADGVAYIHSNGLIHRDLKPENIFFDKNKKIKIGDFGLVTRITGEEDKQSLLRTQRTGTPSYMAPEQIGNQYENEVDIYSLGIIIFELFWVFGTGHERVKEWYDIRKAKLPKDFEAQYRTESSLIKSMLSKNPLKRPKASTLKDYLANTDILCSRTY